jgi:putative solute:sodium symporter small subunit
VQCGVRDVWEQEATAMQLNEVQKDYWQKNLRITALLLAVWFFVTFVVIYFARDLTFTFFGWPFSVWVAGQGALIVYVLIIWAYQVYMGRLDREHDVHEED